MFSAVLQLIQWTGYNDTLTLVGAAIVIYFVIQLTRSTVRSIQTFVIAPREKLAVDLKALGSWAVVTGATDGLGKEYAFHLAAEGLNIVLISRTQEKLQKVAGDLESTCGVKTRSIAVDFSSGYQIYDKISRELADLRDIAVLVNNVGIAVCPDYYLNMSDKDIEDSIVINCYAVSFMTKIVLPKMVERRKGLVINLSSLAGVAPTPLSAVYGATKAYIDFFSRTIKAEYGSKGIIVQSVLPSVVSTAINNFLDKSFTLPDARTYVNAAFSTIGRVDRTAGCWTHQVLMWILTMEKPDWLNCAITMPVMQDIRARVLRAGERRKTN